MSSILAVTWKEIAQDRMQGLVFSFHRAVSDAATYFEKEYTAELMKADGYFEALQPLRMPRAFWLTGVTLPETHKIIKMMASQNTIERMDLSALTNPDSEKLLEALEKGSKLIVCDYRDPVLERC